MIANWCAISDLLPAASLASCDPVTVASLDEIIHTLDSLVVAVEADLLNSKPSSCPVEDGVGSVSVCQSKTTLLTFVLPMLDRKGVCDGDML